MRKMHYACWHSILEAKPFESSGSSSHGLRLCPAVLALVTWHHLRANRPVRPSSGQQAHRTLHCLVTSVEGQEPGGAQECSSNFLCLCVYVCVCVCVVSANTGRIVLTGLLKAIHVVCSVCSPLANLRLFENLNQFAVRKNLSLPFYVTPVVLLPILS